MRELPSSASTSRRAPESGRRVVILIDEIEVVLQPVRAI